VQDYRDRNTIPSWWELQSYKGDSEELAKIKAAYEPYLPLPPVGVHKKIAEELELKAGDVYQAIKAVRLELNLPQFNDPLEHGEEFAASSQQRKKKTAPKEQEQAEQEGPVEPVQLEEPDAEQVQLEGPTHPVEPGSETDQAAPASEAPAGEPEVEHPPVEVTVPPTEGGEEAK